MLAADGASAVAVTCPDAENARIGASAQRKAALRLLPVIGVGYGLAFMDRINISFASLQMNKDLHFSASVYGFGAGLFFIGYALCEVPSNLLLLRFGARRWMARIMFTWGLLAAAMLFVRNPLELNVLRFLLGVAEAGFYPGVIYYLTLWFPAADAGSGGEPILRLTAAGLGVDGVSRRVAHGTKREAGPCRLAMAVSGGRLADSVVQSRNSEDAAG